MIIAVDGPTASGKGTISKQLAKHFALPFLDTGLLYRAVGWTLSEQGGDADNAADALAACDFDGALLDHPGLRSEAIGGLASQVSVHPEVRRALDKRQRDFAYQPAGAVLDGRDIGTVIAPDADAKLFVTASSEARAVRRYEEMKRRGEQVNFDDILADILQRDERDQNRATAPLKPAADADLLDTTNLTIDAAIQQAIALVNAKISGRRDKDPA
ncbi:MAG: (d)CMP kinase [Sphingomonadales bacterium]|nr:(d)CMP kinase [Sphingomonadales bacterium]PIX66417.1 MAG: (d)CMP kinase [Sphingomonadales bacterium CG_4_10_14_3_um_filter_58_15]NCO49565.1 (d)CMP kinase [Sphingomonadales bacterium]NCO98810.1 (d)CMP kinase [Sphingomonadales bacterium]NCP25793.1 (d)CMP kinase [Sphingomonadales bacterium]